MGKWYLSEKWHLFFACLVILVLIALAILFFWWLRDAEGEQPWDDPWEDHPWDQMMH